MRFTSGGGSEALMGGSEGKSMLYLEARCLSLVRAAGSQGVQNGSISCVALDFRSSASCLKASRQRSAPEQIVRRCLEKKRPPVLTLSR